ncbi:TPA: hypothetical protein ACPHT3_004674, partial [Vibrio alginolyticus]
MDAVFPIAQREGDAYYTLSDFTKLFDQAKSGRYLIGQGYGWHSGIHLTSKMLPWGKGLRPIQAMLDGKIVAFRINPDYLTSTYQEQEFKYSNNFVLIEHEAVNPEDNEDVFKFYTLYMHLAPPSDIGANSSITTRYRLQEARNVRTFKHSDVPTNSGEKKQSMSKGTLLEYLYAEEKETHPYQIDKNTYKMIKCRVVENGKSASGSEKALLNKIVWFASGLNSDFDILEDSSAVLSEPVSEPKWMSDKAAMIRDGSVVSLLPLLFREGIKVSAGEDIGYMGLHEYSNDAIGTKKEDNRVHIEMFSFEEPPEFFKKQISPKNAEENPLVVLDGADSSGAVDMSNSFIQQLLESVTEDQVTDFSSFTARDAKVYLDGKRKHFERFIVKHPTDWHTESSQSLYESIHQTAKEALDIKCSAGFVTIEDYRNSPWRDQVMDSFDLFSQFELERADKFSWMQDLQGDLQLSDDKSLWHYWPFVNSFVSGYYVTQKQMNLMFPDSSLSKREEVRDLFNKYASSFEINTNERAAQFFAQIRAEVGSKLEGNEEDLWYSVDRLKEMFKRYFNKYPEEAVSLGYIRIDESEYKALSQADKKKYVRRRSYYYSQLPQEDEIAKRVYSCDSPDGHFVLVKGGDVSGLRYKGKGFIQLTWKYNYDAVQTRLENKIQDLGFNISDDPYSVLKTKEGFLAALGFWDVNNLNEKVSGTIASTNSITNVVNSRLPRSDKEKRTK